MRRNYRREIPTRERASLRASGIRPSKKPKGSFFIRFNICMTMTAAVIFLSKTNWEFADMAVNKVKTVISSQTSPSEIKEKAMELYTSLTSKDESEEVFSDLDDELTEQLKNNKEMEEELKNR